MAASVREGSGEELAQRFPGVDPARIAIGLLADENGGLAFGREPFDSDVLGLEIGRIHELSATGLPGYETLLDSLTGRARALGYEQILRRVQVEAKEEIWALERSGFLLMDVGVTFNRPADSAFEAPAYDDLVVRLSVDADVEYIVAHMLSIPWGSRYETDPTYAPQRVRELRSRWLWNSHRGRATAMLIGVVDGVPAGYVTCLLRGSQGEIELVGTLPSFRGRGVASRLLEHARSWFSHRASVVTVRTQASNYAAARLYEKSGYTLGASDMTYRRAV